MEVEDLSRPLTARDPGLVYRIRVARNSIDTVRRSHQTGLRSIEEQEAAIRKACEDSLRILAKKRDKLAIVYEKNLKAAEDALERVIDEVDTATQKDSKRMRILLRNLEKQNKAALKAAQDSQDSTDLVHPADISRAKTIAVFDGILFAIENWSDDGQTASDFTIVCQSLLFPVVYDKVMSGDEDYYLERVPVSALEVVRRGREFIQHLREQSPTSLVSDESWDASAGLIHEWLINDALPLLYGARDEAWEDEIPYSLAQMQQWRDMPQSRLLDFPKIQDAMDLVKTHGDTIRETTGLPQFTKETINTRIKL